MIATLPGYKAKGEVKRLPALSGGEFYRIGVLANRIKSRLPSIVVERCTKEGDQTLVAEAGRQAVYSAKLLGAANLTETVASDGMMVRVFTQSEVEVVAATKEDSKEALLGRVPC